MFVKIVGVRGSGKTTLSRAMDETLCANGYASQLIKGSDLMSAYLGRPLSQTTEDERVRARRAVYKGLYANDLMDPQPTVRLRDGHCSIVERDLYGAIRVSEVPPVDGDTAQLKAICLLDPSLKTILSRRRSDIKIRPERNILDLGLLYAEWEYERRIAARQATKLDIPLYVFENEGDISETTRLLLGWMRMDLAKELAECRIDIFPEGSIRREFA